MTANLSLQMRDKILGKIISSNQHFNSYQVATLEEILNSLTVEDECAHINTSRTNTHDCCGNLRSARICNDCNKVILDTAEDDTLTPQMRDRIFDYVMFIHKSNKIDFYKRFERRLSDFLDSFTGEDEDLPTLMSLKGIAPNIIEDEKSEDFVRRIRNEWPMPYLKQHAAEDEPKCKCGAWMEKYFLNDEWVLKCPVPTCGRVEVE